MSAHVKRFYLFVAVFASLTCGIYCVLYALTVFVWHKAYGNLRGIALLAILAGCGAQFFRWYREAQT